MRKKGQAALEFLTTYGWAFLVILVMIGALAYFGVLDPTRFLPQRCQFGAELYCARYTLDGTQDIARFELRNSLPDTLYINHTEYKRPADATWRKCEAGSSEGVTIRRENMGVLNCTLNPNTVMSGNKDRVQFKIVYSQGGDGFDSRFVNDLYGEIYANVR